MNLKELYYNPELPSSFGSIQKLYEAGKLQNPSLKIKDVKDWLSSDLTYTLHKPARRNYQRNKILVNEPNEQFQADLVDMQPFSRVNNGYRYILTVIDCFSKYAFAVPVKNKSGLEIKNALKVVFTERKPFKLQTDRGKEFLNSEVQNYLKEIDVHFFTTYNSTFKCAIVERFNRTLKAKMYKYFTAYGTRKYVDVLPKLVKSYNNSYHRTIKEIPSNVNETNKDIVFRNIYGVANEREYLSKDKAEPKLQSGDKVRRKYELTPMDKSFYPTWSDTVYTIDKSIKGPMYRLRVDDEVLPQRFYPEEVQKIKESAYRIEKIVKRETRNGVSGYIVKWIGYSDRHNSWIPEDSLENVSRY